MDIIDKLVKDLGYSREFWNHYAACDECSIELEYEGYVETCRTINPRPPVQKPLPGSIGAVLQEVYGPIIERELKAYQAVAQILDDTDRLNREKGGE